MAEQESEVYTSGPDKDQIRRVRVKRTWMTIAEFLDAISLRFGREREDLVALYEGFSARGLDAMEDVLVGGTTESSTVVEVAVTGRGGSRLILDTLGALPGRAIRVDPSRQRGAGSSVIHQTVYDGIYVRVDRAENSPPVVGLLVATQQWVEAQGFPHPWT